ncbi:carbohydrate-binding module family 12 protein [Amanita thiersii Skay4041]|uniref:Carbohydrate-binding module family 12 protein n=1 Tax=Amanita thiersii Skay4041 TaxID=703135 RepID=A0A2A9NM05_9AGAR|nr:carbohydrate-binding module family 12 protein [Amanita thiersii Skay4041]
MVHPWQPGTQYNYDEVVEYQGHRYKIIQPHRSQSDWPPSFTPALWGMLSDDDRTYEGRQEQQQPMQYRPPADPPSQSAPQYGAGTTQQSSSQEKPQSSDNKDKKHWWSVNDDDKKKLEIGGGLLAGAAAIGAGIFAYKEHEKRQENKNSHQWAKENWMSEAQARTQNFRANGPQTPATWVLTHGKSIPQYAITISNDPFSMFSCRAYMDGGLQLGKASPEFQKGGVLGYKNDEIHVDEYEILLGDMRGLRWVSFTGRLNLSNLGARPVEGGRENDGTPLFIVRAYYKEAVHPGKTSEKLDGAYIPWGGAEKCVKQYEVLCYA